MKKKTNNRTTPEAVDLSSGALLARNEMKSTELPIPLRFGYVIHDGSRIQHRAWRGGKWEHNTIRNDETTQC